MEDWNSLIATLPDAHLLQTREWGLLKSHYGWRPIYKLWQDDTGKVTAAALILERTLPLGGLRVMYIPKGPLLSNWDDPVLRGRVLADLQQLARQQEAVFIKIDPDVKLGVGIPTGQTDETSDAEGTQTSQTGQVVTKELEQRGWFFSGEQIQFRNTVTLDLTPPETELLANMKQKWRYNLRLAQRKGVSVRVAQPGEFRLLYHMYAETSVRDGFVIRPEAYYRSIWESFQKAGMMTPLLAEVQEAGKPAEIVAGLMLFHFAGRAWYLHGMSRQAHREKMPNYLLQWEAIQRAKARGCLLYDLWGAPDDLLEEDAMWGVFRFKLGLGGLVVRTLGAWDYPARPLLYKLYAQVLPRILERMRRRGKARTQKVVMTGG